MSPVITPAVAGAVAGELLTASIRFYFLWKRMQAMEGKNEAEIDAEYAKALAEFEKRKPEDLQKAIGANS